MQMDEFMNRRYEFRYNTQIGEVEYRERFSFQFYFHSIDKRAQNSIMLDAQSEGIGVWDRDIDRYLHSNRVPITIRWKSSCFICLIGTAKTVFMLGKQGSLQKSALGIAFPPLVPEYGFTLERGR